MKQVFGLFRSPADILNVKTDIQYRNAQDMLSQMFNQCNNMSIGLSMYVNCNAYHHQPFSIDMLLLLEIYIYTHHRLRFSCKLIQIVITIIN